MGIYLNIGAILIAAIALIVSYLSWRTSEKAVRASTFNRRFEIYLDAQAFIDAWMRHARPDMEKLPTLVGAWSRSHFLCREEVTQYLRSLWVDAVKAAELDMVVSNEMEGDRPEAVKEVYRLLRTHADYDQLRQKFMRDLKVQ